jgi:pimeloyl-ACP methyl ester carboxylesterase
VLIVFALGVSTLAVEATRLLHAAAVLRRFEDPKATDFIANFARRQVTTETADFPMGAATVRARLYVPAGVEHPPAIVLLHGIHHLGLEEPRLVRFANALAADGILVMTPQLDSLADYHIDEQSFATIGTAAHALRLRSGGPVGVMGLSFAGGLALLAAADPQYRPDVAYVVAVGAHDDAGSVLRFFATNQIERPDGTVVHMQAHEYGALVAVYTHAEAFFPPGDVVEAKEAIRLWLWEQPEEARAHEAKVSRASFEKLEKLFTHDTAALAPEILTELERHREEVDRLSPHGHLSGLRVPVYLLHGKGDNVIPASETLWLARDVPKSELRWVLISPAVVHVEVEGEPTWRDQLALVRFLAAVLTEARVGS